MTARWFTVTEFRRTDPDGEPVWDDAPDPMDRDADRSPLRSVEDCAARAATTLRTLMHAEGHAMAGDPVPGDPQRVRLTPAGDSWTPADPDGPVDGLVIVWTAPGTPAVTHDGTVAPGAMEGGVYRARLTDEQRRDGGTVRVIHDLHHDDVIVTAWDADGEPVGYLVAFEVSDDEVQVEVFADTHGLDVARRGLPVVGEARVRSPT